MYTDNLNVPNRPLHTKPDDDKILSRIVSKESSSKADSSLRFYYGVASGAVPFIWESQPGTPKHRSCATILPPLTPPPPYHFKSKKKPIKKTSRANLLLALLPSFSVRKTHSMPSWSSLSSTSFTSSFSRRSSSSPRSSFDFGEIIEDPLFESTTSASCFCVNRGTGRKIRRCCSMVTMKNSFLSLVGNRSN